MDRHYVYRPILDLIGKSEGTDKGDGYNETLGYGAYTGGDVRLVSMPLRDVYRLQGQMLSHPKNKWNSSAVGRYQIVRKTLKVCQDRLQLSSEVLFDEDTQDSMARYLLYMRGIDRYCEGKISEDKMLTELSKEWASLPKPNGEGYYGNQKRTPVTPDEVREAIRLVKGRYGGRDTYDPPKKSGTSWVDVLFGDK